MEIVYTEFEKIATLFPNIIFQARGIGEEFIHTWIMFIENGEIIYANKPWENNYPK